MNHQTLAAQVMTIIIVPDSKQAEKHDQNKEVMILLHQHMEALFYNVASTISVMALMNGRTKVQNKDVDEIKHYIRKQCQVSSSHQSGGSLPSDYFGYKLDAYSESNTGNEPIVSHVDFNHGIARQAMGPQAGGTTDLVLPHKFATKTPSVKKYIKAIFKKNGVIISKTALAALLQVLDVHISCLLRDIKDHCGNSSITLAKVKKVLALKRHSVFK